MLESKTVVIIILFMILKHLAATECIGIYFIVVGTG